MKCRVPVAVFRNKHQPHLFLLVGNTELPCTRTELVEQFWCSLLLFAIFKLGALQHHIAYLCCMSRLQVVVPGFTTVRHVVEVERPLPITPPRLRFSTKVPLLVGHLVMTAPQRQCPRRKGGRKLKRARGLIPESGSGKKGNVRELHETKRGVE